jgi:hypothetical protein
MENIFCSIILFATAATCIFAYGIIEDLVRQTKMDCVS